MKLLSYSIFGLFLIPAVLFAEYRDKAAGDHALQNGNYAEAASFYQQYRTQAKNAEDVNAERDACKSRINALILAKMPGEAETQLNDYLLKFPDARPISVSLWNAEILLLQKNPAAAQRILEWRLPDLMQDDPMRQRALFLLARACEEQFHYADAAKLYLTREKVPSKLGETSWERGILCLISDGKTQEAIDALAGHPGLSDPAKKDRLRLLAFLIQVRSEGFPHVQSVWPTVLNVKYPEHDPLIYTLFSMIGDTAAFRGRLEIAAEAYTAAYEAVTGKEEAFATLQRLLDVFDAAGDSVRSADLAMQTLHLFRGSYATPAVQEKVALILLSANRNEDAAKLFRKISENPAAPEEVRHNTLVRLIYLYEKSGKPEEASAILNEKFTGKYEGEGAFIRSDLLLRKNLFDKAEESFLQTAERYPELRNKSLCQAAFAMLKAEKPDRALNVIKRLSNLSDDPEAAADAVFLRANALEKLGEKENALRAFQAYPAEKGARQEFTVQALFHGGCLAVETGDLTLAAGLFDRIIRTAQSSEAAPAAACWRIYLFLSQGKVYDAERETWRMVSLWPEAAETEKAMFTIASGFRDSGAFDRANNILAELFRRARTEEQKARALYEDAVLEIYRKQYAVALRKLTDLEENFAGCRIQAEAMYRKGDIFRETGDYENALTAYRRVLLLKHGKKLEAAAIGSIADCCFQLSEKDPSEKLLREALENYRSLLARPEADGSVRVMTLYKAGRCEERLRQDDRALLCFREAVGCLISHSDSGSRLWAAKAGEALYAFAEQHPLKVHIQAAVNALNLMEQYEIIPKGTATSRAEKLRARRYRPGKK